MEFAIHEALTEMEGRIRADIREMGALARADSKDARSIAELAQDATIALNGRVDSLEQRAAWIGAGFGSLFLSALAFAWHVITGVEPHLPH